jgi:hypothetical protein
MIALNNAYFFSHENILALGGDVHGVTFLHDVDGHTVRAVLVQYPDAAGANESLQALCRSRVLRNAVLRGTSCVGESRRGHGGAKVDADVLVIVLDADTPARVTAILAALPLHGDVR